MAKKTASSLRVSNDLARLINRLLVAFNAAETMSGLISSGNPPLSESMDQIRGCVRRGEQEVRDELLKLAHEGWGALSPLQKKSKVAALHRIIGDRLTRKCARAFKDKKPKSKGRI